MVERSMNVDIWSDIACPWCFIGKRRFEKALAEFPHRDQVTVTWHSYQLDPTIPDHYDGGEMDYLATVKRMDRGQVRQMLDHVTATAAGEGLHYDFDRLVVANSFSAHELLHLAKEHGVANSVKESLLSAHFEHGEDIGQRDVLVRIGVAAGLGADEINAALASRRYRAAVNDDIKQARALGIQGVPFFVIENKWGVSGAQPAELFGQALEQAWRESNPLVMVQAEGDDAATCGPDGCAI
jgi:predicted DsbA family dithiol-disulfide isomerase